MRGCDSLGQQMPREPGIIAERTSLAGGEFDGEWELSDVGSNRFELAHWLHRMHITGRDVNLGDHGTTTLKSGKSGAFLLEGGLLHSALLRTGKSGRCQVFVRPEDAIYSIEAQQSHPFALQEASATPPYLHQMRRPSAYMVDRASSSKAPSVQRSRLFSRSGFPWHPQTPRSEAEAEPSSSSSSSGYRASMDRPSYIDGHVARPSVSFPPITAVRRVMSASLRMT
jgi:hypothetical protein